MTAHQDKPKDAPTDLLLALVVDESGSMAGVTAETIDGLNGILAEQRALVGGGRCLVSETIFTTEQPPDAVRPRARFRTPYVATDVAEVPDFAVRGPNWYVPSGGTPLYDAVGVTIEGVDAWLAKHPEFAGKVLVAIWTDGCENQSALYTLPRLNDAVAAKIAAGWQFAFLGTGAAAWTEGARLSQSMGVASTAAVADTARGRRATYAGVRSMASSTRTTGLSPTTSDAYAAAYANEAEDAEAARSTTTARLSGDGA